MKRKAPWIVVMAFSAFSVGAIAAEGDSLRSHTSVTEEVLPGTSPAPGEPEIQAEEGAPSAASSSNETGAIDSRATSSEDTRLPSEAASSSSHRAATGPSFDQVDRDRNGVLDVSEATAAGINFAAANADSDPFLSMAEYYIALEQMGGLTSNDRS